MTVELSRRYDLSAAHHLPHAPKGHKCRGLHGHSYQIEVVVRGEIDPRTGWLMDYAEIDRHVQPLLDELDHRALNDIPGLENPTSEIFCGWLWKRLKDPLPGLERVSVAETGATACHYYGD